MTRELKVLPNLPWHVAGAAVLAATTMLAAGPAQAQDRELAACLAIPDVTTRAACYDAVARARTAPGTDTGAAPAVAPPVAAPAPARTSQQDFGLTAAQREAQRPAEQQVPDAITTTVASARIFGAGYWELVMQDNSVWRLTELRRTFRTPSRGDTVSIRQGAMNSYHMKVGNQPTVQVVRVR